MIRLGSRIQVMIGLWILAGLAVMGINGYALLSLLDEPLAGYSTEVRNADRMFQQFGLLLAAETEKMTSGMDLLARRFSPPTAPAERPRTPEQKAAAVQAVKPAAAAPATLPVLAGIVTRRSGSGAVDRLALLDGRIFSQGDTVMDLTIEEISATGVLLSRESRTWFLKAPRVPYSLTKR